MAMRLSGLMSGMDTDSIVQELVAVRKTKVDDTKKAQKKLEWKQDAWKSLNTKLKNLQNKYISNMRYQGSYIKKTTKVSNSSAVSVLTGENAVNGVQSLKVKQLAKTGYLTGGEITAKDGSNLVATDKMSKILGEDFEGTGNISVKTGNKQVDIAVTKDTTISDILTKFKDAGLNASFDAKNQRFFISAKESGENNDFSVTAFDAKGAGVLSALGLQAGLKDDAATLKQYQTYAAYVGADDTATANNMAALINEEVAKRVEDYLAKYKTANESLSAARDKIKEIEDKYAPGELKTVEEYANLLDEKNKAIKAKEEELAKITDPDAKKAAEEELAEMKKELADLNTAKTDAETLAAQKKNVTDLETQIADIESYVTISKDAEGNFTATAKTTAEMAGSGKTAIADDVTNSFVAKANYAKQIVDAYNNGTDLTGTATKVDGQNAVIELNDATFESKTNVFEINGLTFTALSETKGDEEVTITTQDDTDGIYDMIKGFLKEYNSIINEMDKLYNADSAKGYEPLLDEEKDALSDSEVEDWEKKIKDSLLRRDSNLSSISQALKQTMSAGIQIGGKTMYLTDFGINTLGYFNAPDNEKNAYHIDGDADDENTSGNTDKLKRMISSNPSAVVDFFSKLSQNLYTEMNNQSKSVNGYRSFGSFYDDKKMKTDYSDYTSKIAELEEKLADYEDKWYKKFSDMETAMAKMQSNTSAITSLLGGS